MKTLNPVKPARLFVTLLSACLLSAPSLHADYQSTVLSHAPVGYWQLNETAPVPLVFATNLGTLGAIGNGTHENDLLAGVPGALPAQTATDFAIRGEQYLNGNRVRVPFHSVWNTNNSFSVEFWCKPGQTNFLACPAASTEFADPSETQVVRRGWLFYQGQILTDGSDNGSGWIFRIYHPPSGSTPRQSSCSVPMTLDTNRWYHVVGTFRATPQNQRNLTIYVNGTQAATFDIGAGPSNAYEPVTTNTIPLTFGARADGDFGFFTYIGSVDEPAFYPYLLTSAQILQHYQNGTNLAPATSYQDLILSRNPAGYWRLNEKLGPLAANLGSSAAPGEYLHSAVTGADGPRPPEFTGFAATNHAVSISNNDPDFPGSVRMATLALNTNTVTLTAWIRPEGPQNEYSGIVMNAATDGTYAGMNIGPDGGFQIGYTWNDDASTYDFPSPITVPDGEWSFVAVSVSPTQAVIHAHDGISFQTAVNVLPHSEQGFNGLTRVGMDYIYSPYTVFNGQIDEVAIFNRTLSLGELYTLYAAGKGGVGPSIFQDVVAPTTIAVGETLSLSVDAGGTPNLAYQWRKNGGAIGGATGPSYTKVNVTSLDDGNYDVVITNQFGTVTSALAGISVGGQTFPVILTQPQGGTVYQAGYVNLSVAASGGNLQYHWQRNGAPLADGTNASYEISPAQGSNAGTYVVVVSNSVGFATSDPAVVNVIVPAVGSFEEAMVADSPVSWWRLDEPEGSPTFADAMGRNHGTWVVPPTLGVSGVVAGSPNTAAQFVLENDSYGSVSYSPALNGQTITVECWVRTANIADELVPVSSWVAAPNRRGYMFVKEGPEWRTAFSFGDDFVYTYVTMATISPDRWMHLVYSTSPSTGWSVYVNGVRTAGPFDAGGWLRNTSEPFRIGTSVPGAGDYNQFFDGLIDEVAVYDKVLPASSILAHYQAARFGAGAPPSFVTQPAPQTVAEGLTATFSTEVEGTLPIAYSWSKDGTPIPGATNLTLTVSDVTFGSSGSFVLTATNSFGVSNSASATLTVVPQPTFANLTNGLVLHLKFDGDYTDSTGRGNHGTNVGSTTLVAGRIGSGALSYSTTLDPFTPNFVDLGVRPDLQFGTSTDFSIAFWTRFTNSPGDLPFFANSDSSLGSAGYTFSPSFGEGGVGWSLNNYRYESGGGLLDDGNWHHVLVSVARTGNIVTYVDGTQVDSRFATSDDLDTGFNTVIGQGCFFDYGETGEFELDDLGVWRRALSPIEAYTAWYVGENYNRSFDNYGPVTLVLRSAGGTLELIWQAGTLLWADEVNGTYTPVPGASAPYYQIVPGTVRKFFRVQL